jgi:hypothetical protein
VNNYIFHIENKETGAGLYLDSFRNITMRNSLFFVFIGELKHLIFFIEKHYK